MRPDQSLQKFVDQVYFEGNEPNEPPISKKPPQDWQVEKDESGTPVFIHSETCPNSCDYACNPTGEQEAKELEKQSSANKDKQYAYHVTHTALLGSIKKEGLKGFPKESTNHEPAIFCELDEEEAAIYHHPPETVILRFLVDGVSTTHDGEYVLYDYTISPTQLEIKQGNSFVPLLAQ